MSVLDDDQWAVLTVLVDTFFPEDDTGPAASRYGVVDYIDAQLETAWGTGAEWYSAAPHSVPDHAGHGWQSPLSPRAAYGEALTALEAWSIGEYGLHFAHLPARRVESLVAALYDGTFRGFATASIGPRQFFDLLKQGVIDGLFRDPVFGGNKNFAAWRWLFGDAFTTKEGVTV